MKCPVCGHDCVKDAHEIIDTLHDVFTPCPGCSGRTLNKRAPLPDSHYASPCSCGKRFIDEVFAHMYVIMVEEGDLTGDDPLKSVGSPLIHPGFAMQHPPYLPPDSLVLLSSTVTQPAADRLVREVPEIRGVVKCGDFVPGPEDVDPDGMPEVHTLLAGCDVRANVFFTQAEPLVVYKQQSVMHIEFPRGYDPKIVSVGVNIRKYRPRTFVDALSGPGTLGLLAALLDVPHVVLNDIWYAAAFWSAHNLRVNREHLQVDEVTILREYDEMKRRPLVTEPLKIAETEGKQSVEVYQGDFRHLHTVLPPDVDLTVIDLFEKRHRGLVDEIVREWREKVGGDIFIP